jgi:hypothetical protein
MLDPRDSKVAQGLKVIQVRQEIQDHKVPKVIQVLKVIQGHKEQQDLQDFRGQTELKVQLDLLVLKVVRAHKGHKVQRVIQEHKEP